MIKTNVKKIEESISLINTDDVFNNAVEWGKHSAIINNGEYALKTEYHSKIEKIRKLQLEVAEIESIAGKLNLNIL